MQIPRYEIDGNFSGRCDYLRVPRGFAPLIAVSPSKDNANTLGAGFIGRDWTFRADFHCEQRVFTVIQEKWGSGVWCFVGG